MAETYFYRSGQRIPVLIAESARAARVNDERANIRLEGWRSTPVTTRLILLVSEELFAGRETVLRAAGVPFLLKAIREHEQAVARAAPDSPGERTPEMRAVRAAADRLTERADLATFPVAVHVSGEGTLICSGDIAVQFAPFATRDDVQRLAESYNWSVTKTLSFVQNGFVLRAAQTADPFAFANMLVERHDAIYAHPVFVEDIPERSSAAPVPPADSTGVSAPPGWIRAQQFQRQWHLRNTGQAGSTAGIDIEAVGAWQLTTGLPNVTICVMDSGVNLAHEVFQSAGKLVRGFDFEDNDADPSPLDSSHGTACAALAAGGPTGQALGVAPSCRLMPIRRPNLSNHLSIAEGFVWAADHGADIISCSFGIDGRPWILPDVVRSAFEYVTRQGRAGKGCVIFWAAGNGNEAVASDEWASSKYVIAVAASTDQAQRAPYSDFGPEVSICAPSSGGVNGIVTAVNSGYTAQFGGTSAAAPIAAGVASLVLSVAPHMRWQEVRDLLQRSARKIDAAGGSYDAAGHSVYYGYGQVDSRRALLGISALLEAERATDTESLDAGIRNFLGFVNASPAGRVIGGWISDRRIGVLLTLQSSSTFRDAVAQILRMKFAIGTSLAAGRQVSVPDSIWPAIQVALRSIQSLQPSA